MANTLFTRVTDSSNVYDGGRRQVGPIVVPLADNATVDMRVPIPFKGRLVGGCAVCSVAQTASKAAHIDVEKTAAGGTQLMTMSLTTTSSAATYSVGTLNTGTLSGGATEQNLWIEDNYLNLEVTAASGTSAGTWNVYLYFSTAVQYGS